MMMEKMMQGHMGGMSGMGAAPGTTGMAPGTTGMATGTADVTERIEGRIAFLKAELQITDKQMSDWNLLAEALRSGRQHLVEARKFLVMDGKTSSADRLARYEGHLTERLEAIKSARTAFVRLYPNLDGRAEADRRCYSPAPDCDFLTRESPSTPLNYQPAPHRSGGPHDHCST